MSLAEQQPMRVHLYSDFLCLSSPYFHRYRWTLNDVDFNPSGNDARVTQLPNQGTLVFSSPELKDEGGYQCFVENGYGVAVTNIALFRQARLTQFPYERRRVCLDIFFFFLTILILQRTFITVLYLY